MAAFSSRPLTDWQEGQRHSRTDKSNSCDILPTLTLRVQRGTYVLALLEVKSALEQRFAEELGASNALAPRTSVPVLAAVLARELGFKLKQGEDVKLGKWVRKHHEPIGKAQHGRYSVCVYDRSDIEPTVRQYFAEALN